MAIIKDIIERRVNTTGVSEPVVVTQGNDRVVVELPGVTDPDADPPARRPDRPARLRAARPDRRDRRARSSTSRPRRPPLFSGDQVASASIGQDQSGGLTSTSCSRATARSCSPTTPASTSATTSRSSSTATVISAPRSSTSAIPGGKVQITAGGIGGFPLAEANNLVTILQFGSLPFPIEELSNEHDQRDARRAVPQPEPARRRHRDPDGRCLHGHLLPAARPRRELRARSTTRSSSSRSSG